MVTVTGDAKSPRSPVLVRGGRLDGFQILGALDPQRFAARTVDGAPVEVQIGDGPAPGWLDRALKHLSGLRPPGARRVLGGGRVADTYWWALEAPSRPTLADRLTGRPALDPRDALRWLSLVVDRIAALHAAGIVLATLQARDVATPSVEGCTVPAWLGGPVDGTLDPRTDVLSLGVLGCALLTGRAEATALDSVAPAVHNPVVRAGVLELLEAMVAPRPQDRPYPLGRSVDRLRELAMLCAFDAPERRAS